MSEVFSLKLNTDLGVLSACRTGLGEQVAGEGVIGLMRAFLYAGTPSVVVSLWSVADESTADLMKGFYTKLVSKKLEKLDRAEALLEARRELMKTHNHPFYWAPFILVGER